MISYKIAKKLNDAGFRTIMGFPVSNNKDGLYYPTLSELIEACGDSFEGIWRRVNDDISTKEWVANAFELSIDMQTGSTPEEAVAKIWLLLN